jgi:hypothetical protein
MALLTQPQTIDEKMEHWWNESRQRKAEVLVEDPAPVTLVSHKSHIDYSGTDLGPSRKETGE